MVPKLSTAVAVVLKQLRSHGRTHLRTVHCCRGFESSTLMEMWSLDVAIDKVRSVVPVDKTLNFYKQLVNSIKANGIMVPLLVDKKYRVIDGEHRLAAAKEAKLATVPVKVLTY
jgi:hypothetical protein